MVPRILRKKPTLAIVEIDIYLLPKTTAFGGVATGSMNA
jgi:hypothetical protein